MNKSKYFLIYQMKYNKYKFYNLFYIIGIIYKLTSIKSKINLIIKMIQDFYKEYTYISYLCALI